MKLNVNMITFTDEVFMPLQKRKMHRDIIPFISSAAHMTELPRSVIHSKTFPLEQLTTFSQLLQNFDWIEVRQST